MSEFPGRLHWRDLFWIIEGGLGLPCVVGEEAQLAEKAGPYVRLTVAKTTPPVHTHQRHMKTQQQRNEGRLLRLSLGFGAFLGTCFLLFSLSSTIPIPFDLPTPLPPRSVVLKVVLGARVE